MSASPLDTLPRRINIGCGYDKREGYLNVDVDPACEPDLLLTTGAELSILPDGYFDEVRAWDVLEHIPHAHAMSALLDWSALLPVGGRLVFQTSYLFGAIDVMREVGTFETDYNWTRMLFGNQAHPGDYHYFGFTERTVRTYLVAAGFDANDLTIHDRWLLQCEPVKMRDWTRLLALPVGAATEAAYETYLERSLPDDVRAHYERANEAGHPLREIIKSIISAPEHLYKLGASLDAGRAAASGQVAQSRTSEAA